MDFQIWIWIILRRTCSSTGNTLTYLARHRALEVSAMCAKPSATAKLIGRLSTSTPTSHFWRCIASQIMTACKMWNWDQFKGGNGHQLDRTAPRDDRVINELKSPRFSVLLPSVDYMNSQEEHSMSEAEFKQLVLKLVTSVDMLGYIWSKAPGEDLLKYA